MEEEAKGRNEYRAKNLRAELALLENIGVGG
jgi:hypothetical protein